MACSSRETGETKSFPAGAAIDRLATGTAAAIGNETMVFMNALRLTAAPAE
jgi:hypothetical protein